MCVVRQVQRAVDRSGQKIVLSVCQSAGGLYGLVVFVLFVRCAPLTSVAAVAVAWNV